MMEEEEKNLLRCSKRTSHKLWFEDGWAGESSMAKGAERGVSTPTKEAKLGPVHRGRTEKGTST